MPRKQKKSKLNEPVSTRVGVILILFIIFVVGLYTMNKAIEVYGEMDSLNYSKPTTVKKSTKDCRNRGFEGSAQIRSWYEKQGDQWVLRVAEEDLAALPLFDNSREYKLKNSSIKIIDMTSELDGKLKSANKNNPVPITITGYVYTCNGEPLACLEYRKEKIKPYIL